MPCAAEKTVQLAYGRGRLEVSFPSNAKVIEPRFIPGLSDEKNAVTDALRNPIQSRPLAEWIKPDSKICVLFTDITRATPNERLIPWLLEDLSRRVPKQNITLVNSVGTEEPEQWQVIVQMVIQRRAEVLVHSQLPDAKVLGAKMLPCHDIAAAVRGRVGRLGPETRVAVLPQGPLTIPYVRQS